MTTQLRGRSFITWLGSIFLILRSRIRDWGAAGFSNSNFFLLGRLVVATAFHQEPDQCTKSKDACSDSDANSGLGTPSQSCGSSGGVVFLCWLGFVFAVRLSPVLGDGLRQHYSILPFTIVVLVCLHDCLVGPVVDPRLALALLVRHCQTVTRAISEGPYALGSVRCHLPGILYRDCFAENFIVAKVEQASGS
ncbi:hypothetical protein HG530_008450 [Fusarium avenaceum]|nr:hypothetical protein HG530_008450 [Fusarium avenaceum]